MFSSNPGYAVGCPVQRHPHRTIEILCPGAPEELVLGVRNLQYKVTVVRIHQHQGASLPSCNPASGAGQFHLHDENKRVVRVRCIREVGRMRFILHISHFINIFILLYLFVYLFVFICKPKYIVTILIIKQTFKGVLLDMIPSLQ